MEIEWLTECELFTKMIWVMSWVGNVTEGDMCLMAGVLKAGNFETT